MKGEYQGNYRKISEMTGYYRQNCQDLTGPIRDNFKIRIMPAFYHFISAIFRMYQMYQKCTLKGIVSRDWGGLQMILLDRLEVFNISASGFFFFLPFLYSDFKIGRLSGASFQHSSSNDHYSSGDSNSLPDS